jgi:hypothetical protein
MKTKYAQGLDELLIYFDEEFAKWKEIIEDDSERDIEQEQIYQKLQTSYNHFRPMFETVPKLLEACIWTAKGEHHPACIHNNPKRGDVNACNCYVGAAKAAIATATGEDQ